MCQNKKICQCLVASATELLIARWLHQNLWLTSYDMEGMRLSFKPNVTCGPTRNLWFVNVFSTFKRPNSVVKIGSWSQKEWRRGDSYGTTGTMVNPALIKLSSTEKYIQQFLIVTDRQTAGRGSTDPISKFNFHCLCLLS